ncbi:ATPase inhibitor subunit zeta [Rhizobium sullae]|uniref:ATPase inhibitor subunit zeta n=1 Tax=Rhizobium sullae TaxID=50338 RepID=UPI001FCD92E7|nr:ATPase inhibitor subunit zeta [Rhizobium sullae]
MDTLRMVRRNKLVGMWAAQKLGLVGESATAYSNDLARGTLDVKRNDVLAIIRRDFDAAGVVQSKEQILSVMTQSWLDAGRKTDSADASDAALVQIARNLQSK